MEVLKQTESFNNIIDNILNLTDFVLVHSNFHESKSNCWYVRYVLNLIIYLLQSYANWQIYLSIVCLNNPVCLNQIMSTIMLTILGTTPYMGPLTST